MKLNLCYRLIGHLNLSNFSRVIEYKRDSNGRRGNFPVLEYSWKARGKLTLAMLPHICSLGRLGDDSNKSLGYPFRASQSALDI